MKTQYKKITLISLLLLIIINCLGQTYSPTTIYTPNHTSVTASILTGGELSQGQKDDYLDFWLDWYDDRITCVGEATRTYNCHAWAWRISDGGSTVWLNTPGDDAFWTDDSYIEIASQSEATKISYGGACYYTHPDCGYADWCDHSAITTGTQDYFVSKWGESPRFSHDVDDCPYDDQHLHYYARPYITGTTLLCSAGSSYTINDLPSECDIVWTCSANVSRVSSQGSNPCTFQANGSGNGWISATITSSVDEIDLQHFSVWVGTPIVNSVSGPYPPEGCPYTSYAFCVSPTMEPISQAVYTWSISPSNGYIYPYYNDYCAAITFYAPHPGYRVRATVANSCGSTYSETSMFIGECKNYMLSPNPASDIVTITRVSASEETDGKTIMMSSDDENTTCDIQIVDYYGSLHLQTTKSGDSFTLPVSNLKDGTYFVKITSGKKISNLKLVVKH